MKKVGLIDTARASLRAGKQTLTYYKLSRLKKAGFKDPSRLPYSIRVLLESALRNCDGFRVTEEDVRRLANWGAKGKRGEVAFVPARVILQDFTGVPAVADLAAMRSAMKRAGGDPARINPLIPCDLVVDHSVQMDFFGTKDALGANIRKEFSRNRERYEFLKWAKAAFSGFGVVPPAAGIIHQVNLEYLAKGAVMRKRDGRIEIFPDSLVGTDSHTTMINGIGVAGWGVGGIEAEAVMLGEPIRMLLPEVVGMKLTGWLREGVTATDLVLAVTELLRKKGVVGKFVEYYGDGVKALGVPDRAVVANMAPEYGATMGFFPVDRETIAFYKQSGRSLKQVALVERYMKAQGMFAAGREAVCDYSATVELNLASVEPALAGPKRPQDRVLLKKMKTAFASALTAPVKERGYGLSADEAQKSPCPGKKKTGPIRHGAVAIASITSCTNTSNPSVMIAAGLLAKNAVRAGLSVRPYVKTTLAPGSRVVTEYLRKAGLLTYLEKLKFHVAGYGCATCIGNSGPLVPDMAESIERHQWVAASVLSGNRNFEGRVNPLVKANYLASPPLVVAYALAGTVDIDLQTELLGTGRNGKPIYLKDIWPKRREIEAAIRRTVKPGLFKSRYAVALKGTPEWARIPSKSSVLYPWKSKSTYIQEPPFFKDLTPEPAPVRSIRAARVLVMLGDSVTTDHISPAGSIAPGSPAGAYLRKLGVKPQDFNSYGSRRGNDQIMTRGTFANVRLRNQLRPGTEGSCTVYFPLKKETNIYDAAQRYKKDGTPLIILAGKEYGTGSSRDWAAKGTVLLGVRAVIAQSYERIHRSNLVGMGILPLEFKPGESRESLGLKGDEVFDFSGPDEGLKPGQRIKVKASTRKGVIEFDVVTRIDTPVEVEYYKNGGILQTVLRKMLR